MSGLVSVLLVIACSAMLTAVARAEPLEGPGAAVRPVVDEPAPPPSTGADGAEHDRDAAAEKAAVEQTPPPPATDADRAKHDQDADAEKAAVEESALPPATDADPAKREGEATAARPESQAGNVATTEVSGPTDSMCLSLELAAAANGLPLEFFARVIWEESRFQPNAVGPTTRSGHRAQGIAQFMPYTATQRGLLNPFNPEAALPEAAEFLAELRSEFGNLGLAAAAYNAGPGRVRDFIGRRGSIPAQTRHYVRAITGRPVDEWAALGREGGKDGILKPILCRQLAALLKGQPSFLIGKVEGSVREAALRPQGIPDGRNASSGQSVTRRVAAGPTGSVAARNGQVRAASLPTTERATRQPKTSPSAASAELRRSSAALAKSGKSTGAALRATSVASTLSDSKSASPRSRTVSPKGIARENAATRVAAGPTGSVAARNRNALQVRTSSLPTTERAPRQPKTSPSAASVESRRSSAASAKSGKSTGAALRATSVASTLSDSKPASGRAVSPKGIAREKAAEDRLRKIMQICRC